MMVHRTLLIILYVRLSSFTAAVKHNATTKAMPLLHEDVHAEQPLQAGLLRTGGSPGDAPSRRWRGLLRRGNRSHTYVRCTHATE